MRKTQKCVSVASGVKVVKTFDQKNAEKKKKSLEERLMKIKKEAQEYGINIS